MECVIFYYPCFRDCVVVTQSIIRVVIRFLDSHSCTPCVSTPCSIIF